MARWFSWLRRSNALALIAALAAIAAVAGLGRWMGARGREPERVIAPDPDRPLPGTPLGPGRSIGAGTGFENLTVFPIYSSSPEDAGELTTLEAAIAKNEAEVRELGSAPSDGQAPSEGGARVDRLEIENEGALPIMVLAGTVLRGGKQDRQVGEDVVIAPGKTVQVAAFCVERGRWNGLREGAATEGKFSVEKTLATGAVRAAGQYENDQGDVWNKVAEVNAANRKEAPSGTLLATLGDAELASARDALFSKAKQALEKAEQPERIVGLAYAVDGTVRSVRWFAGRKLFGLHADTLLRTAALEALTAQATAKAEGRPIDTTPAPAAAATQLVEQMEKEVVVEQRAGDGHSKSYKKSSGGYASELVVEGAKTKSGSPKAAPTSVTKDFVKK